MEAFVLVIYRPPRSRKDPIPYPRPNLMNSTTTDNPASTLSIEDAGLASAFQSLFEAFQRSAPPGLPPLMSFQLGRKWPTEGFMYTVYARNPPGVKFWHHTYHDIALFYREGRHGIRLHYRTNRKDSSGDMLASRIEDILRGLDGERGFRFWRKDADERMGAVNLEKIYAPTGTSPRELPAEFEADFRWLATTYLPQAHAFATTRIR